MVNVYFVLLCFIVIDALVVINSFIYSEISDFLCAVGANLVFARFYFIALWASTRKTMFEAAK